jgi:hypothetical protein
MEKLEKLCLIMIIWVCIILIGIFIAFVFDNQYFVLRVLLLYPFVCYGIIKTIKVTKQT